MYNIPVVDKLNRCLNSRDSEGLAGHFTKYDVVIQPPVMGPGICEVDPPSRQLESYELLAADYVSRTNWAQHYLGQYNSPRRRSIIFVGPDADLAFRLFWKTLHEVEEAYKRRYYGHHIDKGTSAAVAYRSGFLDGVLRLVPYPERHYREFYHIMDGLRFRMVLSKIRSYRDQAAYSLGTKDGSASSLVTVHDA